MLRDGKTDDAVWMMIDEEAVPGRLVTIEPAADVPGGCWVNVKYSDVHRGSVRRCFAASVYPDDQWAQANAAAKGGVQ